MRNFLQIYDIMEIYLACSGSSSVTTCKNQSGLTNIQVVTFFHNSVNKIS
jgi:hypothetical protein